MRYFNLAYARAIYGLDRLKTRFDAQRTVELVATVAAYNMVSRFLVALGVVH